MVVAKEMEFKRTTTGNVDELENLEHDKKTIQEEKIPRVDWDRKLEICWRYFNTFLVLYIASFLGIYYIFQGEISWNTLLFSFIYGKIAHFGVTAGSHRFFSHKSYKAKLPTRIGLMLAFTACFQGTIIQWSRDHRLHHKFTDREPDPYNSSRGFFYSHFLWLLLRKGKLSKEKGAQIDLSDLWSDPVVRFHEKHYYSWLMPLMAFGIPTFVSCYFFGDQFFPALCMSSLRHIIFVNLTSLVNSFAHIYGNKPYDKNFSPCDSILVSLMVNGESFHNYHHVFPNDYQTSELPFLSVNITTLLINMLAKIGQTYDLKTTSPELINKRSARTGDGSRDILYKQRF